MTQEQIERDLLDTYAKALVAPDLAEARGVRLQSYTQELRKAVARHLRHEVGASVATIARHMNVSGRWVSKVTNKVPGDEPFEGWYLAIMDVMTVAYPESLSPLEVQRLLRRSKNRRIGLNGVQAHLELYSGFGKLVKVGERYRASGLVMGGIDPEAQDRIKKVAKRLRRLSPLCQAYVRGDQGAIFGQLVGQMDMGCASDAADEIQVAVEAIILRHAERSRLLEASGEAQLVNYSGLILFGQTREEKA